MIIYNCKEKGNESAATRGQGCVLPPVPAERRKIKKMKNGMTFEQYDKACDFVEERVGSEELALNIVNGLCKIFNLQPTEIENEFLEKALSVLLGVE